jgi:hypothetical protein
MDIYSVWHKGKKVDGPVAKIKLSPQDEEPPVAKAPKRAELPTKKELVKEVKQTNKEAKQKEQNEKNLKTQNTEIMKAEAKKSPAKKEAPKKLAKAEKTLPRGNNMYLTAGEWAKVDALLAKKELSFSAWSRGLVQAAIK